MESNSFGEDPLHEVFDVTDVEGMPISLVGHVASSSEGHLVVLNVKCRFGELVYAPSMVIVEVSNDHIRHRFGVHT